ncbi:MAG: queuosine precursor transporter [Bacteroidaceae bacterium]|nr:queuosine precursor transporter [Bacteroidaceae bacterium]
MQENRTITVRVSFMIMGILFCVCLIAANLFETKIVQVGSYSMTAGFIVFPVSYIINDCIAEVWGFRKARLIIWMGFLMNFFVVALGGIAVALPAAPFWEGEEAFRFVFGLAPRIAVASLTAFLVGSFLNAWVMSRMKLHDKERRFAWRAILSTLVGEGADSIIFFPMAFAGLMPVHELAKLMVLQVTAKTLYEIIVLPITTRVVRYMKRREGTDTYDTNISYNIFKIKEL